MGAIAGRLALTIASFSAAIGFAETALRGFGLLPIHRDPLQGFYVHEPTLGWIGSKGYTARFRHDDFDVVIANDERGFRRAAVAFAGASDAPRWAFLGDSFTWGWGVAQGEVFTDQLQLLVGDAAQMLNYGVIAYGTGQQRIALETSALPDRPNVVAVMFFANDALDTVHPKKGARPYFSLEGGELRLHNQPVSRRLIGRVDRLGQHSIVLSLARQHWKRLTDLWEEERILARPPVAGEAADALPPPWQVVSAVMAEMKEVAKAADPSAELRVVYVPMPCDVVRAAGAPASPGPCSDPPRRDREYLAAICDPRGIPLLDLTDAFASAWREHPDAGAHAEPYYFRKDGHWTALGHRLAAQRIHEAWRSLGLPSVTVAGSPSRPFAPAAPGSAG